MKEDLEESAIFIEGKFSIMIVFLKWLKQSPEILADKRSTSESLAGTYLNTFFIKSIAPR